MADLQLSLLDDTGTTRPSGTRVLLTQSQLAAAFGLAPSTISRWPLQAVERRGREVYYDLREAIEHCVGELGRLDLQQERARLARVQTERQELQLARERGQLLPAADVEVVWCGYIANARARLLALPEVAAPRVVGETVVAATTILRGLVYDALEELAAYDPEDFSTVGAPPAQPQPDVSDPAPRQGGRQDRRKRSVVDAAGAPSTGAAPPQELEAAHAAPPGAGRVDPPRPATTFENERHDHAVD